VGVIDPDVRTIVCWKHGCEFSLETGEALTLPATQDVPVYDARVDDGQIVVVVHD
jgi:3-phenylpropionate/trans-cinnamate dioxygenase ferredoxin subunit